MNRCTVEVSSQNGLDDTAVLVAPAEFTRLGLSENRLSLIRFGTRSAGALFRVVPDQPPGNMILSSHLAGVLSLDRPLPMTAGRDAQGTVTLGPLVGLLVSQHKFATVLAGAVDTIYCRYARHAGEIGAVLCFFTLAGLDAVQGTVQGYLLRDGEKDWQVRHFPVPTVIYDRCFGESGRTEAARVRELAAELGCTVVNRPMKITKLEVFEALRGDTEVNQYLPYTVPASRKTLAAVLDRYPDLYFKPNALYKGKGVLRLTRQDRGWVLQVHDSGLKSHRLPDKNSVEQALTSLTKRHEYVIQEGLPLATYFGNRFDFRSLVQKDGRGAWTVSGLVARLAPVDGTITSPRSGGQVARAADVLRHAFPDRWESVLENLKQASVLMARKVDAKLGPCIELGLDIGVLRNGSVKLIEANGKPLRVSLQRLRDPLIDERIHRFPIHCAAAMDVAPASDPMPELPEKRPQRLTDIRPLIGVLLNSRGLQRLRSGDARYHVMAAEARQAGGSLCFFTIDGMDRRAGAVDGCIERGDTWVDLRVPLPDVIYNRATYSDAEVRVRARTLLSELVERDGVVLLNGVNAFGKMDVCEALSFFGDTADLSPETVPFTDIKVLDRMLERHGEVFVKADQSSHGSDVLKVEASASRWLVQGHYRGAPVREQFQSMGELQKFLNLLRGKRRWVVQQAVDLLKVNGRIFDIRTIVQKNGEDEWAVPLVLVRWAQPGEVVTNTSRGAEPILPAAFLALAGQSAPLFTQLKEKATSAALHTVAALESRFGRLGEVGVDIGLDSEGNARVLEANSKPFHRPLQELPQPLVHHPIQFAVHLAVQKREGRQSGISWTSKHDRLP